MDAVCIERNCVTHRQFNSAVEGDAETFLDTARQEASKTLRIKLTN